jgi:bifunctional DNA-binding transcriptional regulator/antitoxin component of YhaV-PrlF toxin-antitoxin module
VITIPVAFREAFGLGDDDELIVEDTEARRHPAPSRGECPH